MHLRVSETIRYTTETWKGYPAYELLAASVVRDWFDHDEISTNFVQQGYRRGNKRAELWDLDLLERVVNPLIHLYHRYCGHILE